MTSRAQIQRDIRAYLAEPGSDPLAALLLPPGKSPAIGPKSGSIRPGKISRHVSPHGSTRYLRHADGRIVSGFQVVSADDKTAKIAGVYTLPTHRGLGLATDLLRRARRDFSSVEHAGDRDLSPAGRGWRDKTTSSTLRRSR